MDELARTAAEIEFMFKSLAVIIVGGICAEAVLYRRYKKSLGDDVGILESIGYGIRYLGEPSRELYNTDERNKRDERNDSDECITEESEVQDNYTEGF